MLRLSKTKLEEEESISRLYSKARAELESRKYLYERFRRKVSDTDLASKTDEEIKVPLERYLAVMCAGYFGGMPPVYKVRPFDDEKDKIITDLFDYPTNDEQEIKEIELLIEHIIDYNDDSSLFLDLVLDFVIKRACYEIIYKDEATSEITIARSDALETVAIWDYSAKKNLIGLYRIIDTINAEGTYDHMIELISETGKRYYYSTDEKIETYGTPVYQEKYGDEPLFIENKEEYIEPKFDDIPVVAYEQEDGVNVFEELISLIMAYERSIQNSRNVFKYNDEAILAVTGYQPENPMTVIDDNGNTIINPARTLEDEYVLESRVRYLDLDGKIEWVEKNVNDSAVQNHKKTLMDIICLCSFVPNMTDLGFTSADNNSALEKKFFSLQQYIATFEGLFKKGLLRRWRLILEKINKDRGKSYDYRDIEIFLQRNIPSDENTKTQNALKLRGLLADESVINMLPYDLDAKSELRKMQEQSEANIEENLKQMQMMGQAGNTTGVEETEKTQAKETGEVVDLTETQKAQKLTADNKKEQEKEVKKQVSKTE